ncbi:MAG: C45 family autoproteolytic acyltransferase/hydrolase [Candidatus Brocadiales bacterium]|nr:C45 family autoproteolytic acyltransferase/hydrolase [Candidatus Bathyanammoxibius amoris]
MVSDNFLPTIHVSGSNYDIGFQTGKTFQDRINSVFTSSTILKLNKAKDQKHPEWLDQLYNRSNEIFPQYIQEIKGIADGAGINFRDVLIHNFRHCLSSVDGCATIVFKSPQKIIIGHNEDYEPVIGKNSYITIAHLENNTQFLALTNAGSIPGNAWGFNSHGLVFALDSLPPLPDINPNLGFPRILLDRYILESQTLKEAVLRTQMHSPRSGTMSYTIISMKEFRGINIETTSTETSLTEITDIFYHVNHYTSETFEHLSLNIPVGTSRSRYKRGKELLKSAPFSKEGFIKILSDKILHFDNRMDAVEGFLTTFCTPMFEISADSINLELYPHDFSEKGKMLFSLNSLN